MSNNPRGIPEINIRVIVIGILLSIVMGSANVYLGLKAGMTVSASIPAAVVGMLVLRQIRALNNETNSGSFELTSSLKILIQNFVCPMMLMVRFRA